MRASIKGGFWALVVCGVGLGAASVLSPLPDVDTQSQTLPAVAEAAPEPAAVAQADVAPAPEPDVTLSENDLGSDATPQDVPVVDDVAAGAAQAPDVIADPQEPDVVIAQTAPEPAPVVVAPAIEVAPVVAEPAPEPAPAPVDTRPAPAPAPVQQPAPAPAQVVVETIPAPDPGLDVGPLDDEEIAQLETEQDEAYGAAQQRSAPAPAVAPTPAPTPQASQVLPRNPAVTTPQDPATQEVAPEEDAIAADAPALLRFAAEFENPEKLPVIGLILIDNGAVTNGPALLLENGIVATVAVSALAQDATLWAEAYRAAGAEVAMQVPLPEGATPVDVEVAYAAAFELLPEATMLFSDGNGVLRNDRSAGGQVMQILASEGRGFVTVQRGLGSLVRAAERAEVPVATVVRDIDGAGESVGAMNRALDQAAFRARQSGGGIVLARLTPETLGVLRNWAMDAARDGILVGPVSAIMLEAAGLLPTPEVPEVPEAAVEDDIEKTGSDGAMDATVTE